MRQSKTILITGAAGFVGKALTNTLIRAGYNVEVFVRAKSDEAQVMALQCPAAAVHEITNDYDGINDSIKKIMPDCVVHLATYFSVGTAGNDIKPLIESNILFGTMLIHSLIENGVKSFINTGTFWQHYQNEDYNPVNVYAATKQAFYDILKYYQESADFNSITLELSDTFGPNDGRKKIINLLFEAAKNNQTLIMSPGEQRLEFLYIDDVVSAFFRAIEILEDTKDQYCHKKYHVSTDADISLRELVNLFNEVSSDKVNVVFGGRDYRPREIMSMIKYGEKLPGWSPKIDLRLGLQKIVTL